MGSIFRVINSNGDIEVSEYKKANAIFQTNEYSELEEVCIHKEVINVFDLLKENQELKKRVEEYKKKLMIVTKAEIKEIDKNTFVGMDYFQDKCINYETHQKEFIKWLEKKQFFLRDEISELTLGMCNTNFQDIKIKVYQEVLQKYKQIIGDDK